ncbi:SPP1 family predicted phage head-tail adaptor [Weissella uvarum]|uniref:phage head closure protein n=1 Tax=Bacilli TaxID=91061 RepID=UPI0019613A44|nr:MULTISPECIES: phage head closure protein [Bacilli]MBM7617254.1 SPP1 family predicted phage head-tail adaptor [Weissella uvarum]MCM0595157.1 phage head closure protein [Weissella uvarum]MDA5653785.1 phage head closure protein [Staphylococcus aureus]
MANQKRIYKPYELNRKADFGTVKSVQSSTTGAMREQFIKEMSLYYAPVERGLTMESKLEGTKFEDTISIAVRHNKALQESMVVKLADVQYKIVKIQPDDSNNYVTYDKIILKKVEKAV